MLIKFAMIVNTINAIIVIIILVKSRDHNLLEYFVGYVFKM